MSNYATRSHSAAAIAVALLVALFVTTLTPCDCLAEKSNPYADGMKAYWSGDFEEASLELRKLENDKGKDYVLYLMNGAAAAMSAGDFAHAEKVLMATKLTIEQELTGEQVAGQVLLSDEKKTYTGHQYEKVLVSFLLGLSQYMQGRYDDARVGFMEALEADEGSKVEYEQDVSYVHYMLAKTFDKLGQRDNMAVALRNAERHASSWDGQCAPDESDVSGDTAITIVLLNGLCPSRGKDALTGAFTTIEERKYVESSARFYVDGTFAGCSVRLTDMLQQAKTSGGMGEQMASKAGGVMARKGIATVADAIIPGGSCITGAILGDDEADVRFWSTAPGDVQICEIPASPGLHTLRVEFLDAKGEVLSRHEQVWYYIDGDREGGTTLVLRSMHDIHNQNSSSS